MTTLGFCFVTKWGEAAKVRQTPVGCKSLDLVGQLWIFPNDDAKEKCDNDSFAGILRLMPSDIAFAVEENMATLLCVWVVLLMAKSKCR